jgi:adenosine deaminase
MIDHSLPVLDLHRHIEGSMRLETVLELAREHGLPLPAWDVEGLRPHFQVTEPQPDIMVFIERITRAAGVLADVDACRRVAFENVVDAEREGLDYVELRFSPWYMAEPHGLDPAAVVAAVVEGVAEGVCACGLGVGLIGILSRTYGPEVARRELEALLTRREHLVALDLAGDEALWPGERFVEHFRRARDVGWRVTVHAGEAAGPASVLQAIEGLGATRIGHAVRATEDPALLERMAAKRIGIEANLTSNVQTSTVPDFASHPLRLFLEQGLLATINTDDPSVSGIDLAHEYQVAVGKAGLTSEQARQAQRNALEIAFLPAEEKQALLRARSGGRDS